VSPLDCPVVFQELTVDVLAAVDHRQDRVEDAGRGVDLVERRLRKEGGSWG
jgi:hypothetical protein